jgi:C-terminal processing protease CtpA/Prc
MIRFNNWLAVGSSILAVALQGGRTIQERRGVVGVAKELPGEAKAVPAQADEAADEKIEPEKLRADFRIARQALEEGHSGIDRYSSREELRRIFDQAEKSLTRPMSTPEFFRVLAPVVAAIKCGHTAVSLPTGFTGTYAGKRGVLPLEVRVLEGKTFVWRDLSGGPASLAGMEIRSINGVPASTIVEKMLAAAPGDGDIQTGRMRRIGGWTFSSRLLTLVGLSGPYDVALRDSKENREIKVHLEGADLARLQEAARARFPQDQPPTTAGEFQLLDEGRIAVMKIREFGGFVDAGRKRTLREFYRESFDSMNRKGTKTLVLDLRDNGGGEDELGKLLLSYLLDKPFKYYDELVINAREFTFKKYTTLPEVPADAVERRPDGKYRLVKHPNLGVQQPSRPTFAGKVLILINGGSFSTTAEFLSQAHYHRRATFIGEESGGGYYGNTSGAVPALTLPNTKLIVHVPLVTYYVAVGGYKAGAHGVLPDHPIRYTIEELLAGKDKELALALGVARLERGSGH